MQNYASLNFKAQNTVFSLTLAVIDFVIIAFIFFCLWNTRTNYLFMWLYCLMPAILYDLLLLKLCQISGCESLNMYLFERKIQPQLLYMHGFYYPSCFFKNLNDLAFLRCYLYTKLASVTSYRKTIHAINITIYQIIDIAINICIGDFRVYAALLPDWFFLWNTYYTGL